MRSELQYNLQKARALATELRNVLEEIESEHDPSEGFGWEDAPADFAVDPSDHAGAIEAWLDDMPALIIGDGHVRLTIEEFKS